MQIFDCTLFLQLTLSWCLMFKSLLLAGLSLLIPLSVCAEPVPCQEDGCAQGFVLSSTSETSSYGLLITAPDPGCRRLRYRIETEARQFLGHTPPLGPGETVVVRVGQGFAQGLHALSIRPEGCRSLPAMVLRVVLRKPAPNHGWRAERHATLLART
jgi:hypothetical protein